MNKVLKTYPEIDDCMNNIWQMREKYNACHPEEEDRLIELIGLLSKEDKEDFLKREEVLEFFDSLNLVLVDQENKELKFWKKVLLDCEFQDYVGVEEDILRAKRKIEELEAK